MRNDRVLLVGVLAWPVTVRGNAGWIALGPAGPRSLVTGEVVAYVGPGEKPGSAVVRAGYACYAVAEAFLAPPQSADSASAAIDPPTGAA